MIGASQDIERYLPDIHQDCTTLIILSGDIYPRGKGKVSPFQIFAQNDVGVTWNEDGDRMSYHPRTVILTVDRHMKSGEMQAVSAEMTKYGYNYVVKGCYPTQPVPV